MEKNGADKSEETKVVMAMASSDEETEREEDKNYRNLLKLKQEMLETKKSKRAWKLVNCNRLIEKQNSERKLMIFVTFLLLVIIVGLVVIYYFHEDEPYYLYKGPNIVVNEKTLDFQILNHEKILVASGTFWKSRPKDKLPYDCSETGDEPNHLCLLWKRALKLNIANRSLQNDTRCYDVIWSSESIEGQHDCFDLGDAQWFGGGLVEGQKWPLQKLSFSKQKFLTGKSSHNAIFGPVLERYWLNSKGVAIVVSENSSLEISINQRISKEDNATDAQFCLYTSQDSSSPHRYSDLKYTVCVAPNILAVHRIALPLALESAVLNRQALSNEIFETPFWSTWSNLKTTYNQESLLSFAGHIQDQGCGHGVLLVDDGWEYHYGDVLFDNNKFPDPISMVNTLHQWNFTVSLIVHTHVNTDSLSFHHATLNDYLVKDAGGQVPGLTRWSTEAFRNKSSLGIAGILDVSEDASLWHKHRLNEFKNKHSIDSFHFSGGEMSSLPSTPSFHRTMFDPNDYTKLHARLASTFGSLVPIESVYKGQNYSLVFRIVNKKSTWNQLDGLQSIIPAALSLGLSGYQLFLPEASGGSGQPSWPDKELFIRWLQLNAFLPFMHLSIPPDHFDDDTKLHAQELIKLRHSLVVPEIQRIYESSIVTEPIIRPIWWLSPADKRALECTNEFLVGDKILVAPVLTQGSEERDIFLPEGLWEDRSTDQVYIGPKLLEKYPVTLYRVAYFIRK